ncbi:CTP-dependent riboflavin kinase [Candidatus Woesearchaeota archaeon]|nr:CTP-dependent riboflavin kinase [Candidatus Woesearchaeota archaeon]
MIIEGIAVSGLGEGSYFMSMGHYRKEIKKKLKFDAYQGTLNLKVKKKDRDLLKKLGSIEIKGYKTKDKMFYGAKCYKARVQNISGAIIMPGLNKHGKDIIEFIAPVHLKSKLKIKDGDRVTINII